MAYRNAREAREFREQRVAIIRAAEKRYKTSPYAPFISGGFHESWDDETKQAIRALVREENKRSDAAEKHWKAAGFRKAPPWRGR